MLREGERVVPFPDCSGPYAWTLDGEGVTCSTSYRYDARTLNFETPGTYRTSMRPVEVFLQIEPVVVEARRREVIDIVIQLVRAR